MKSYHLFEGRPRSEPVGLTFPVITGEKGPGNEPG